MPLRPLTKRSCLRVASSLLVALAAPQDAINATTVLQMAVYTLIPVCRWPLPPCRSRNCPRACSSLGSKASDRKTRGAGSTWMCQRSAYCQAGD